MYRASGQAVPVGKRILELNPKHPLVTGLKQVHKNRSDDSSLVETAELLTAQPFSPAATYPRTRQSSPDCSRSVWPAP
jgi:HSP90 family molecular chaperone